MADYADLLYGNLAYDTFPGSTAPEYVPPQKEPAAPSQPLEQPEERAKARPQSVPVPRQGISVFAIVGVLCAAVVFVMLMLSYIRLTQLSHETVRLEQELSTLEKENIKLKIKHESAFKLDEVEAYAVNELGMVKAESEQIVYLNNSREDRAVILADAGEENFIRRIVNYLRSLLEYL